MTEQVDMMSLEDNELAGRRTVKVFIVSMRIVLLGFLGVAVKACQSFLWLIC